MVRSVDNQARPSTPTGRRTAGAADEIAGYVRAVVGPEAPDGVVAAAVAEIGAVADAPIDGATAGRAREVALQAVERRQGRLTSRLSRLAHLRHGCRRVPGLLTARASGRIEAGEVAGLYRHLDACRECAALAGRFDAAEWQLHRGTAAATAADERSARTPASHAAAVDPPAAEERSARTPESHADAVDPPAAEAAHPPEARPVAGEGRSSRHGAPAAGGVPADGRRPRRRAVAAGAADLAAAPTSAVVVPTAASGPAGDRPAPVDETRPSLFDPVASEAAAGCRDC